MSIVEASVIPGEAPESDEDQEDTLKCGVVVEGEAPESDDELISFQKNLKIHSDNECKSPGKGNDTENYILNESVLQKKLYECNISLWKNLTHLVQNNISSVSKQLIKADQQLLKSQVTLQSASHCLKATNVISKQVLDKTRDILSANFVPSIEI